MGSMHQCSLGPILPLTMFQNPMSKLASQKIKKTIITQKVLVTQSSYIVHCDQHTQKPICAEFQAFLNTFSLLTLTFLLECMSELRSTGPKLVLLLATRCHYKGGPSELRSSGPNLVLVLATRCLYQRAGLHLTEGQPDQRFTKCQADLV